MSNSQRSVYGSGRRYREPRPQVPPGSAEEARLEAIAEDRAAEARGEGMSPGDEDYYDMTRIPGPQDPPY